MLSDGSPPNLRDSIMSEDIMSTDFPRHMSSGSLNIPGGLGSANGAGNGQTQNMPAMGSLPRFDGPRSPPGKQNTSHVPCKFFRQGACQAGKACPFSHDLSSTTDNVCKYFAKGNCKFGPKCANIHVLPDGRRVNYNKSGGIGIGGAPLNIGGRVNPDAYHGQSSALTSSFMRANMVPPSPYGQPYPQYQGLEDGFPPLGGRQTSLEMGLPTIDTSYAFLPGSAYGSPRDDELHNRFGLGLSPVAGRGLSVMDAPLPSSFDSNGVSNIARHGKLAASVPSKFGFESPPHSLGSAKEGRTSEALKNLHSSAFGNDTRDRFNGIAASPPAPLSDDHFGKRVLHSQRYSKPKIMSSSVPKSGLTTDKDWDPNFAFEEDYLPDNLKDLLTPQEKARRGSRAAEEEGRAIYSGMSTPTNNDGSSKFGSPSNASPSRWGPLFERKHQQRDDEEKHSRASLFGHVGSPLRNSSLHYHHHHPGASPSSSSASPNLASPPTSSSSMISQQLQRTRLSRAESSSSDAAAATPRSTGGGNNPITAAISRTELDRQISSSSIGTTRLTTPIDEEQGDFVFSMEEEEEGRSKQQQQQQQGAGWNYPVGGGGLSAGLSAGGDRSNGTNDAMIPNGKLNGDRSGGLDAMFGSGGSKKR